MVPATSELIETLTENVEGQGAKALLDLLCSSNLIDRRAAEALYIRRKMDELTRCGVPRCKAMRQLAGTLCCSYERVRAIVYARDIN